MPRIILALTVALWLAASAGPASAYTVFCSNCSEAWTQQMERITNLEQLRNQLNTYHEAIQQTQQQIELVQNNIQQYRNMIQNTLNLPANLLNKIKGEFSDLARLVNTVKLLKGDVLAMSQVFNETYPGLDLIKNIAKGNGDKTIKEIWEAWSGETDRAAEATFQVTGQQLKDLAENSEDLDRHIGELLSTPEGQMQALQSGNALAAIQVDEMRKLRSMMAVSIQSATQALMKGEKREQLSVERREHLMDKSGLATQYQGYK